MQEQNPDLSQYDSTELWIASLPRENAVGKRCSRYDEGVCRYGEFCICAADEKIWLEINEPEPPET